MAIQPERKQPSVLSIEADDTGADIGPETSIFSSGIARKQRSCRFQWLIRR